jgi:acyl-CoA thioesterase I
MPRIVALGDSTTAGTPGFLSPVESPPDGSGAIDSQYAWWLMRLRPDWEVLNRGVNRERTDQIAARFHRDVLGAQPDLVIIIGGVNDIYDGYGAAHAISHLGSMYERARAAGILVVAGTILPFNSATPEHNAQMREVNAWIAGRRAEAPGEFFVADTRATVARPDDPDRLASTPDGLHPDADGYRRMAEALAPVCVVALGR